MTQSTDENLSQVRRSTRSSQVAGLQDHYVDLGREDRVPRFWANSSWREMVCADSIVLGVGVCFGAIHCIAWSFSFPTHTELLIWRISSVAITAVPIYISLGFILAALLANMAFRDTSTVSLYLELWCIS